MRSGHEVCQRYTQSDGELLDVEERNVPLPTFHAADVRSMQTSEISEFLLRDSALLTDPAECFAKSNLHIAQEIPLKSLGFREFTVDFNLLTAYYASTDFT